MPKNIVVISIVSDFKNISGEFEITWFLTDTLIEKFEEKDCFDTKITYFAPK